MSHTICTCLTKCTQQCHCRDYMMMKPFCMPRTTPSSNFCHDHNPCIYARANWQPLGSVNSTNSAKKECCLTVSQDKDKFQVNLDISHFKAEELSVKVTTDNTLIVEGRHDEKEDEHGIISRHFVRKYMLPSWCDPSRVDSKISIDGILTVTAPKMDYNQKSRNIPIISETTVKTGKDEEKCPCTE